MSVPKNVRAYMPDTCTLGCGIESLPHERSLVVGALASRWTETANPAHRRIVFPAATASTARAVRRPRSLSCVTRLTSHRHKSEFTGSARTELSPETVQEFQVVNNGLSAESGGGASGPINVITKTGINTLHGDAFVFVQNSALNARDPLTNETAPPDLNRFRAGLSAGGPIVHSRTLYYVAGEQEGHTVTIAPSSLLRSRTRSMQCSDPVCFRESPPAPSTLNYFGWHEPKRRSPADWIITSRTSTHCC